MSTRAVQPPTADPSGPRPHHPNGKELRHLHDVVKQHMRVIEAMKSNSWQAFMLSIIELKLDQTSIFAWQDHSHDQRETPAYTDLLEFLDRRAHASENTIRESERKHPATIPDKGFPKSYATNVEETCIACKSAKHPLYGCRVFQGFPHSKKLQMVRENELCLNCLKPGHFANRCPRLQRCKKCHGPHHLWHHVDKPEQDLKKSNKPSTELETRVAMTHISQLLMTCQVQVLGPDGTTSQVRALLDSASSASFISERLTQHLRLSRHHYGTKVSGIGGDTT